MDDPPGLATPVGSTTDLFSLEESEESTAQYTVLGALSGYSGKVSQNPLDERALEQHNLTCNGDGPEGLSIGTRKERDPTPPPQCLAGGLALSPWSDAPPAQSAGVGEKRAMLTRMARVTRKIEADGQCGKEDSVNDESLKVHEFRKVGVEDAEPSSAAGTLAGMGQGTKGVVLGMMLGVCGTALAMVLFQRGGAALSNTGVDT